MKFLHSALLHHTFFHHTLLASVLFSGIAVAQTTPTLQSRPAESRPAAKPAASSSAAEVATVLPSEETVNAFLFQMLGYDAAKSWKVTEIRPSEIAGLAEVSVVISDANGSAPSHFLVSNDGKHVLTGDVLPFGAKPFDEARAKLEKGVNGPSKGGAKPTVTIVEFSDMECPHCAKAASSIDQLLAQEPEVHFVFQNFPLPAHAWAEKAAEYVDCVGRESSDSVWKFVQKTFDDQSNITPANVDEKLKANATASGANAEEIAACAAKPDTKARVEASVALGRALGVNGTPTLFINGQSIPGTAPADLLKKIVDFKASQAGK